MKILYVTSEANPFAASGGLGDVMGALPRAVLECGHEVEVIMPYYDTVAEKYRSTMEHVTDIQFDLSWRKTGASVYKNTLYGVTYYFIENHYYFDRGRLYGEFDDAERFAFFSKAVVEFILGMDNPPDRVHCNDWQTSPTVIYLKTLYSGNSKLSSVKTIYTIHNIEYQGKFDPYILGDVYGLDTEYLGILEYNGCLNLMKGAIVCSDYVTTVSPNYSRELEYDFFAFGLSEIIKANRVKMEGVINGIDYEYFSPDRGGDIVYPYKSSNYKSGKAKNKADLQARLGLEVNSRTPLISMITRLTAGKGIDLVLAIIEELLQERCQFVILGTGEEEYENAFLSLEKRYGNLVSLIKFDRAISKQIYASSDIFLMPSKSEPCGLAQMISCSYGTVPIVRAVGGLYDSIIPYGEDGANGFRFDTYNAHELLFTVKRALQLYSNKTEWNKLTASAKASDFSWSKSAEKYISIYNKI